MESFREFVEHDLIKPDHDLENEIIHLYSNNATIKEIKQAVNCSVGKIYRTLQERGISSNRLRKNHEMIQYYADVWELPTNEIAKFTKYTPRWVRKVLKRGNNGGQS